MGGAIRDPTTHKLRVEAAVFPAVRASWTMTGRRPGADGKPALPRRRRSRDAYAPDPSFG